MIDQLLYEKHSIADTTYGVDIAKTDWNTQASKSALEYFEVSSFARRGLTDQLLYGKYTQAEAEYGASKAGHLPRSVNVSEIDVVGLVCGDGSKRLQD